MPFLTSSKWKNDVENSIHELEEEIGSNFRISSENSVAYAKLEAVYPGVDILKLVTAEDDSKRELLGSHRLDHLLGQTKRVTSRKATQFRTSVSMFMDDTKRDADEQKTAFWPLIRVVKLYLKKDILINGLVLVDLPGVGDSNAGRRKVGTDYLKNLDHVIVVARILRAVDDGVARDLLNESFQKRLLLTDKYKGSFVTFVATATDDINCTEVVDSLRLEKTSLKHVHEKEENFKLAIKDWKSQIRSIDHQLVAIAKSMNLARSQAHPTIGPPDLNKKRKFGILDSPTAKFPEALNPEDVQIQKLMAQHTEANKNKKLLIERIKQAGQEMEQLRKLVRAVCIRERNLFTQERFRVHFETGLRDLERDLKEASGNDFSETPNSGKCIAFLYFHEYLMRCRRSCQRS